MAMNILEQEQGLAKQGWGSPDHMHAGIEAMRLSFSDALSLVADPEVRPSAYLPCIHPHTLSVQKQHLVLGNQYAEHFDKKDLS